MQAIHKTFSFFLFFFFLSINAYGQVILTDLKTELLTDPTSRGYAPFVANGSNTSLAGLINQIQGTISITKAELTGDNILNATVISEIQTLGASEREIFTVLVGREFLNSKTTGELALFFNPASTSRPAIQAILTRTGSRSEQLFGENFGSSSKQIAEALALP